MPEMAGRGKFAIPLSALCHWARNRPGVVCHCVRLGQPGQVVSPQSISFAATVLRFAPVASSNTLLLGSMTAITTTTAATSCMPSGATWQHRDGGVGDAIMIGVPLGVGVGLAPGVGVGVGIGLGHTQI